MKSELLYPTEGKGRSYTVEGRTGANSGLCLRAGGAGSGLCARPLEAPGHAQHLAMERGVVAESGWAFHAAGGILDWPVLHRNRFKFSLFLRRKHRPVTAMSAATCMASGRQDLAMPGSSTAFGSLSIP